MMKTVIIGLDAFDPVFFENLSQQDKLPNLGKLTSSKGYSQFQVSNPAQSEVSWTSIATGLNPGGHGMFDFVHRIPENYNLFVSLLPTGKTFGGTQFVRPFNAKTIFDMAVERGYPATSMWWPATFPASPDSPVRSLPGLGTPDIQGRLGIGCLYSSDLKMPEKIGKTPVLPLKKKSTNHFSGELNGPIINSRNGSRFSSVEFNIILNEDNSIIIQVDKKIINLRIGEWSPILELRFKVGLMLSVTVITRLIVTQIKPDVRVYFLPLQLHPLKSPWRYGTPRSFVKESWQKSGPFLTLGWPQDTTGLDDGCINDEQFLQLCEEIFATRVNLLRHHLNTFNEGLLACVFDSLDRIQHMFWHNRPDIIESWYVKLDNLVGVVMAKIAARPDKPTRLLILSDHGFKKFDYKVNLNRWLIENGFLITKDEEPEGELKKVDWSKTRAYAIGLNSLYLNVAGREGQGIVLESDKVALANDIERKLSTWEGPDGRRVIQKTWHNHEALEGPLSSYGPDLLIGYTPGYRASSETGLGAWTKDSLLINNDHWGADHCINPTSVPGVIFSNRDLSNIPHPSYKNIPQLAIDAQPDASGATPPPTLGDEDQEKVEERLKSLGYL